MGCSVKKLRGARRKHLFRSIFTRRKVVSWNTRKGPHTPIRKLRAMSGYVGHLSGRPIGHVIERSCQTRRLSFSRRLKGNWRVTALPRNEETFANGSDFTNNLCLSSSLSYTPTEWDALSSSSRIDSPRSRETGKPEVEGKTNSNVEVTTDSKVEVTCTKETPQRTDNDELSVTQLGKNPEVTVTTDSSQLPTTQPNEKPEVTVKNGMPFKVNRKKYAPRIPNVNERLMVNAETVKLDSLKCARPKDSISQLPVTETNEETLHEELQVDAETVELDSLKCVRPKDSISQLPLAQSNDKPGVKVWTEMIVQMGPKKYGPQKVGPNERLVNKNPEEEEERKTEPTIIHDVGKCARSKDSISHHSGAQSNGKLEVNVETKINREEDSKKCTLEKPEVGAETESTVDRNKYAPQRTGISGQSLTPASKDPEVQVETKFAVKLDPRKYASRIAGTNESSDAQLLEKSETEYIVIMDREKNAPSEDRSIDELCVTQTEVRKPKVAPESKSSYVLDPKKYLASKVNISDPSVSTIDGDDCCIVFEKSGSFLETSTADLIERAVEKERKNFQENSVGIFETPCPLMAKIWKSFTARVDSTSVQSQDSVGSVNPVDEVSLQGVIRKGDIEETEERTHDSPIVTDSSSDVREETERMFNEEITNAWSDLNSLDEDSDLTLSPVKRDLPNLNSPEKSQETRHSDGRTFQGDSEPFPRAKSISNVPTKEDTAAKGIDIISTNEDTVHENQEIKKRKGVEDTAIHVIEQDTTQVVGDKAAGVADIDEPNIPVLVGEDPVMVDAETNTTARVSQQKRCHCRMTNFKIRRLNAKVVYLKKLMLIRTRNFKADRDAFTELLKGQTKVMNSCLRVLRSQALVNKRLLCREVPAEVSRIVTEKQSSSTQTEPVFGVEESAKSPGDTALPVPDPEVASRASSTSRRLFVGDAKADKGAKRRSKRPLSLSRPCNSVVTAGWGCVRQKAAELVRQKCFSSTEETRDTSREILSPDDSLNSIADSSLQNKEGNSFEEEEITALELQAVYEELKADEEAEIKVPPKRQKKIRFQLDENEMESSQLERTGNDIRASQPESTENDVGASQPESTENDVGASQPESTENDVGASQPESTENDIGASQYKKRNGARETPSPLKSNKPNRGSVKSKPQKMPVSPDEDSWNDYIKDLVGRLSQDFSTKESQTVAKSSEKFTLRVEFQNEDILSYLFLDEQFVFTSRKIDPAFKEISHDDAALARIVSELQASGDIDEAERAVRTAGILDCANFDNIRKQLRQYLKVFSPPVCFCFRVHLDIQTGVEEFRVLSTEARCRDDRIEHLEGYKVSVKSSLVGSLPKFIADDAKEEEDKIAVVLGPASFINQDSFPNVKFVSLDRHTVGVVAIRDILPGEELLISHGLGFSCKKQKVHHPRKVKEKARYDCSF